MSLTNVAESQRVDLYALAFDQIAPGNDGTKPIDCLVPWDLANVYMQAIEYMTGRSPSCNAETCYRARLVLS